MEEYKSLRLNGLRISRGVSKDISSTPAETVKKGDQDITKCPNKQNEGYSPNGFGWKRLWRGE